VNRYQLLRELGRGGCGIVYEARDTVLGRHVALKRIRPGRSDGDRLRREAEVVARLDHPNIIALFDLYAWRGVPSLVFELLRGETLDRRLARGPLPPSAAVGVALGVCLALMHAHGAGVLHRDLKPANVGLASDGRIKVLDFGLARLRCEDRASRGAGTPGFMAPEQRCCGREDERTDVFAVGALLCAMITGAPPSEALRQRMSRGGAADELTDLVARAVAGPPAARPASARAFCTELQQLPARGAGHISMSTRIGLMYRPDDGRRAQRSGSRHRPAPRRT
jgi:serine/threonine protein kinase